MGVATTARELSRRGADRDVPGWGLGASGGGYHGSFVGHAGIALDSVGTEQEDLWDDRGLAQSTDRGRASLRLPRRNGAQAQLAGEVRNVSLLVAIGVN